MEELEKFLHIMCAVYDESRIRILAFLLHYKKEHTMLCVCDLQHSLDMSQSRLSRHLKILKDAGFLKVKRQGEWAYYGIKDRVSSPCLVLLEEIKRLNLEIPPLNFHKNTLTKE